MTVVIRTERLSKNYGRRLGIADVSIEVYAGEVFGYLGPNGAGKTTTIRVLMDFIRADGGRAEIFGLDVFKRSKEIRRRVGFLPGELNLYENLTCEGLLRFFAGLRSVEILFGEDFDARAFAAVAGLEIIALDRRSLKGRMKGEMDPLLKAAARFHIADFSSQETGLEDVFLAYYGENGDVC